MPAVRWKERSFFKVKCLFDFIDEASPDMNIQKILFCFSCFFLLNACCKTKPIDASVGNRREIAFAEASAFALKKNFDSERLALLQAAEEEMPSSSEAFDKRVCAAGYDCESLKGMPVLPELQRAWAGVDFSLLVVSENSPVSASEKEVYLNRKTASLIEEKTRRLYWRALSAQRMSRKMNNLFYLLYRTMETTRDKEVKERAKKDIERLKVWEKQARQALKEFYSYLGISEKEYVLRLQGQEKMAIPFAPTNVPGLEIKALDSRMELKPFVFQPQAEREEVLKQLSQTMPVFKKKTAAKSPATFAEYGKNWAEVASYLSAEGYNVRLRDPAYVSFKRQLIGMDILTQVHLSWAMYNIVLQDYQRASHQLQKAQAKTPLLFCNQKEVSLEDLEKNLHLIEKSFETYFIYADLQYTLGYLVKSLAGLSYLERDTLLNDMKVRLTNLDFGDFSKQGERIPPKIASLKPPVPAIISLKPVRPVGGQHFSYEIPRDIFKNALLKEDAKFSMTLDDGSSLPSWMVFDTETLTLKGTAPTEKTMLKLMLTGRDSNGQRVFTVLDLIVDMEMVEIMALEGSDHRPTVAVVEVCPIGLCKEYPFEEEYQPEPVFISPY